MPHFRVSLDAASLGQRGVNAPVPWAFHWMLMAAEDDELTHLWWRNDIRSKLGQLGGLIKYIINILMGGVENKLIKTDIQLMCEGSEVQCKNDFNWRENLRFLENLHAVSVWSPHARNVSDALWQNSFVQIAEMSIHSSETWSAATRSRGHLWGGFTLKQDPLCASQADIHGSVGVRTLFTLLVEAYFLVSKDTHMLMSSKSMDRWDHYGQSPRLCLDSASDEILMEK